MEELRETAVAGLAGLIDAGDPAVGFELHEWANQDFMNARYGDAAVLLESLLRLVEAVPVPEVDENVVRFNLASAKARLGEEQLARELYAEVVTGLHVLLERGDAEAADRFLAYCQHPSIGLILETDPPLFEMIQLGLSFHTEDNLARAEALWNASTILWDLGEAEASHRFMQECVAIARGFDDNQLMLGLSLVDLARVEWDRGASESAVEHCLEARELLRTTGGRRYRIATRLIVTDLVERVLADPQGPETHGLVQRAMDLAAGAEVNLHRTRGTLALRPWWKICGDMARMHAALAESGSRERHAELAGDWSERLRTSVSPYLSRPHPVGFDLGCIALADALLGLPDATPEELELALELADLADRTADGRLSPQVALGAEARYRLGDFEGAVREGHRALTLSRTSCPVRNLAERVREYEAALAER